MIEISEWDRTHVQEALLTGDWWGADLLRLISKSDPMHTEALRAAFPSYVEAYEAWYFSEEE